MPSLGAWSGLPKLDQPLQLHWEGVVIVGLAAMWEPESPSPATIVITVPSSYLA